jgi:hypothetical protein
MIKQTVVCRASMQLVLGLTAQTLDLIFHLEFLSLEFRDLCVSGRGVEHCSVQLCFQDAMLFFERLDMSLNGHMSFLP